MATIERFEDLISWQKARELASDIWQLTSKKNFSGDFSLVNQINRSSGSVMDNIAEGFERGGNKEFIQFLYISKASLAELKSQLYRALDRQYIDNELFSLKEIQVNDLGNIIGGFIKYLQSTEIKGRKFFSGSNLTKH